MSPSPPSTSPLRWIVVVIAGVVAAMHIWKLPGALEGIRAELGISLVLAGPLLGVVQVASMLLGLAPLYRLDASQRADVFCKLGCNFGRHCGAGLRNCREIIIECRPGVVATSHRAFKRGLGCAARRKLNICR